MAATPALAIPYPIGTDRVMDGDNAMQAMAERVEALMLGKVGACLLDRVGPATALTQSPIDVFGAPIAIATVTGRRYLMEVTVSAFRGGADATAVTALMLILNGANVRQQGIATPENGVGTLLMARVTFTGAPGQTVGAQVVRAAGNTSVAIAGTPQDPTLTVFDIGLPLP
jgi:hypothetical protein